jgi:transposase
VAHYCLTERYYMLPFTFEDENQHSFLRPYGTAGSEVVGVRVLVSVGHYTRDAYDKEPTMHEDTTYVGLDAHKKQLKVALLKPSGEFVEWAVANEPAGISRMARKIQREAPGQVECCYEAGPCGYDLQRQLCSQGMACIVVAPSLIPTRPGDRIKTDARDARKLAELLRAGLLTEVAPPTEDEEALRDLCRCREDAKQDLTRARHRLSKFLTRRGYRYTEGKKNWTRRYGQWLRSLRFDRPSDQATFDAYLLSVLQIEERSRSLEAQMETSAKQEPYMEPVAWLRCFRGFDTVSALSLVAELHGFSRFRSPRQLMAYLGVIPSEYSSGDQRRQGGITKTGNTHARRLLVEAAHHYRHRPMVGSALSRRRQGQPGWVIAHADRAMERLHRRFNRLLARGKPYNKTVTAVARELVGFLWAVLYVRVEEGVC